MEILTHSFSHAEDEAYVSRVRFPLSWAFLGRCYIPGSVQMSITPIERRLLGGFLIGSRAWGGIKV